MFNNDFFPTPERVIRIMVKCLFRGLKDKENVSILEPSAGKGDILDYLKENSRCRLYAIEADPDLHATLAGKGHSVIAYDFLTYNPGNKFDGIIMNPPFSSGAEHLLHAWEIMTEGVIVCLLNRETIDNPHTRNRQLLNEIIKENGRVYSLGRCFAAAERKTGVDVVLVRLKKEPAAASFDFFENVSREKSYTFDESGPVNEIAIRDVIGNLVLEYEKVKELFADYFKLRVRMDYHAKHVLPEYSDFDKYLFESLRHMAAKPTSGDYNAAFNTFLDEFKTDCWKNVFSMSKFQNYMTKKVRDDFADFQRSQAALDFTKENIEQLFMSLLTNGREISQRCIEDVFDLFTKYHEDNRVHIEGWKTDKAWKVAKKVILPYIVERWSHNSWHLCCSRASETRDIDIAMCAISGKKLNEVTTIPQALENKFDVLRQNPQTTTDCESTFFDLRFYKKGTVHLTFKDKWIWQEFNLRACKMKGWLPSS